MSANNGTAIVTGASRGIGRAIALQLARDGYDICFCYRQNSDLAQEVADRIGELGREVFHQPCDISDYAGVQTFVKACEQRFSNLTVLVNCAGIVKDNPLVLMPEEDWYQVVETNLNGTFHFCRSMAFYFMKRKQGTIVNISSVAGIYGSPSQSNYAATKAGIIGFSKSLAKELARYNIRVNSVAPGFIETDMTAQLDDKRRQNYLKSIPMGEFGTPEDVAHVVSFLVSSKARYLTGQTIQVDGGISI